MKTKQKRRMIAPPRLAELQEYLQGSPYTLGDLCSYIAGYVQDEIEEGNKIDHDTIECAIDAFIGGAYEGIEDSYGG